MIFHRFGKANNPYMSNNDPSKSTKFLTYLDAIYLNGWAMAQPHPTEGLIELVDPGSRGDRRDFQISEDHKYGALVESDLQYSKHFHDSL